MLGDEGFELVKLLAVDKPGEKLMRHAAEIIQVFAKMNCVVNKKAHLHNTTRSTPGTTCRYCAAG